MQAVQYVALWDRTGCDVAGGVDEVYDGVECDRTGCEGAGCVG